MDTIQHEIPRGQRRSFKRLAKSEFRAPLEGLTGFRRREVQSRIQVLYTPGGNANCREGTHKRYIVRASSARAP
jgi:hypothetical protein